MGEWAASLVTCGPDQALVVERMPYPSRDACLLFFMVGAPPPLRGTNPQVHHCPAAPQKVNPQQSANFCTPPPPFRARLDGPCQIWRPFLYSISCRIVLTYPPNVPPGYPPRMRVIPD